RDVKPGNVLLGHDGRVVLTDFGIATLEGDSSLTGTGLLLGAPAFIAPERARGLTPGPPSDMWSLGATLFTAIEGHPPYDRGTPLATLTAMISEDPPAPTVDGPLGAALTGLLNRDPQARMGAPAARKLLERARKASARTTPEKLGTTLENAIPPAVVAADRTQLVARPGSAAGEAAVAAAAGEAAAEASPVAEQAPPATTGAPPQRQLPRVEPASTPPGQPASVPGPGPAPFRAGNRARPSTVVIATLAVLLVAAIVIVLVLANRGSSPGGNQAGGSGASPTPKASQPSSSSQPSKPAATSGPANGAPGVAPAGYTLYTDPTGFSVAVPDGWQKTRQKGSPDDGQIDFVDPTNAGRFLRFGYTSSPKNDPVADWKSQERSRFGNDPSYKRISIVSVDYRGYPTADWDFTLGSTRVKNRGFKASESHGYAIYLSAPGSQWSGSMKYFDVAAATFKPAS
ncbi:MAG: protein kinase, partial [Mycobacteriales bacterium]